MAMKGNKKFHACVIKKLIHSEHRAFAYVYAKACQFMLTYALFDNSANDDDFARMACRTKI